MAKRLSKSLGESLVEDGIITEQQLKVAKDEEKRTGQKLRTILVRMGMISEEDLVSFISSRLGIPRIELDNYLIDPKLLEIVPEELARKNELIPVLKIGNRLTCAMVDPWNIFALDEIKMKTNLIIEPACATESEIKKAQDQYYGAKGTLEDMIKTVISKEDKSVRTEEDAKSLEDAAEEPLVIRLVNLTIMKALQEGASDIHIEPEEDTLKTRFRIDGMLREVTSPPKHLQSAIVSRIKIMANLNIAERRVPQDGRFSVKVAGRQVDVRVSCVPTIYGENVVLRLLDTSSTLLTLEELGFSKSVHEVYQKLIARPHGIILVTGPTGSGKTTTLYASLEKINTVEKNIITIEDPVEYRLPGIRQIQVNRTVNLTFANGLRSILRQDPDIIMVGEMRDYETTEIAIHAALTGHLVFSTLHTNDAPGAISRMIDMGIEPFLVSASVIGVIAQRLVRAICKECKEEYVPTQEALKNIGLLEKDKDIKNIRFYRGRGCSKCMNTGYKGRIGIFELMCINDRLRNLIVAKRPIEDIRREARVSGMVALRDDGIEKIRKGLTTVEEVLRVTQEE